MWLRILAIGLLVVAACTEKGPSLRARSAGDLHCPAETLTIYKLDDRAYRVAGCQQEVVYISVCDAPEGYTNRRCTWAVDSTRNSAVAAKQPDEKASAAGCSFDTQCKGDRICVQKQCVAPPAPSAAGSAASSAPSP
jgi:hypothetical protein